MNCFNKNYSKFYDYLYKKKDYSKEFSFIKKIIKKHLKNPTNLMDLGCGTGEYSKLMTKLKQKLLVLKATNTGSLESIKLLKIARNGPLVIHW